MIHRSIHLSEQSGDKSGKQQHARHQADAERDDDAEVEVADAAGHGLVQANINEEVGRAHSGQNHPKSDEYAAQDPVQEGGRQRNVAGGRQPAHEDKHQRGDDDHDQPMAALAAFFGGFAEQRRQRAGNKADEQPDDLHRIIRESQVDHGGEQKPAQQHANPNRRKKQHVLNEIDPEVGQEIHQRLVQAQHDGQHATRQPRHNRADANHKPLQEAHDPVTHNTFRYHARTRCTHTNEKLLIRYQSRKYFPQSGGKQRPLL